MLTWEGWGMWVVARDSTFKRIDNWGSTYCSGATPGGVAGTTEWPSTEITPGLPTTLTVRCMCTAGSANLQADHFAFRGVRLALLSTEPICGPQMKIMARGENYSERRCRYYTVVGTPLGLSPLTEPIFG